MLDSIMGDIDSGASVNDVEELFFGRSLLLWSKDYGDGKLLSTSIDNFYGQFKIKNQI
jgi:hypothetical protein